MATVKELKTPKRDWYDSRAYWENRNPARDAMRKIKNLIRLESNATTIQRIVENAIKGAYQAVTSLHKANRKKSLLSAHHAYRKNWNSVKEAINTIDELCYTDYELRERIKKLTGIAANRIYKAARALYDPAYIPGEQDPGDSSPTDHETDKKDLENLVRSFSRCREWDRQVISGKRHIEGLE